jgi:tetratricopeptide (TPR) repeat protein
LILAAVLGSAKHKNVVQAPNTYVDAMLMLGLHFNEVRQYDEGLAWLDRGLALQPRFWPLILERAASLMALGRNAEAAASLQGALNDQRMSPTLDRARFTRVLGVALIELDRLDEAEAALNESIRLQPDNPGARNELAYIAQLRAGAPRTNLQMSVPGNRPEEPNR